MLKTLIHHHHSAAHRSATQPVEKIAYRLEEKKTFQISIFSLPILWIYSYRLLNDFILCSIRFWFWFGWSWNLSRLLLHFDMLVMWYEGGFIEIYCSWLFEVVFYNWVTNWILLALFWWFIYKRVWIPLKLWRIFGRLGVIDELSYFPTMWYLTPPISIEVMNVPYASWKETTAHVSNIL